MNAPLSADEKALLNILPADESLILNSEARTRSGLSEDRYWVARDGLVERGLARCGRGRGGKVAKVGGDAQILLAAVPSDGSRVPNAQVRSTLEWDEDRYWRVRDELIDAGLLERGPGRGGTVSRVIQTDIEPSTSATSAPEDRLTESDMYPSIIAVLKDGWAKDERLDRYVVELTARQGRRVTGGKWTRPDIAILSEKRFPLTNQRVFDVTTFEVKRPGDWDITAIYEAAAHSTQVSYAYAFFAYNTPLAGWQEDILHRCELEADRLGVGLITASNVADYETWDVRLRAQRQHTSPEALEAFVATQISDENITTIKQWWDA